MTFLWEEEKEKLENKPASVGDIMCLCRGDTIIKGISQTINKWYSPKADQLQYSKTGQTRVFLWAAVLRSHLMSLSPLHRTGHVTNAQTRGSWPKHTQQVRVSMVCETMMPMSSKKCYQIALRLERCYQTTPRVESVLKLLKDYFSNMDEMLKS